MIKKYKFNGTNKLKFDEMPTNSKKDDVDKKDIIHEYQKNVLKMKDLQEILYADSREGLIVVFQALDAAGKDSSIKHVMTYMNPQGVKVINFKSPSPDELAHDYLWRVHVNVPKRGEIAIFNRGHYEDVATVQVHSFHKGYKMAERVKEDKDIFKKRYNQIVNFEEYLYENSYRVVKIFLNVSKEKQLERLLERIDRPDKHWKFDPSDLKDRALFDNHLKTYEEIINNTATKHNPWYVLPADQKWYTRYLISEIMVDILKDINPAFPKISEDEEAKFSEYRDILVGKKPLE